MSVALWDDVPATWREELAHVRSHIDNIDTLLREDQSRGLRFNPRPDRIFRCLELKPVDVQVIIVGQDPYPRSEHATGLAFSVPSATSPLPPTLKNILKELAGDSGQSSALTGDLTKWHQQGVLLLNRILTTTAGSSLAHATYGWQAVTEAIIEAVVARHPEVVAVLWGAAAQEIQHIFNPQSVIATPHPSPLSAYRGFFGSRPFSQVNNILERQGRQAISW